jgi:cytochrome c peroxidase
MKRIRQGAELVVVVIKLAVFGETAFFARHGGAQNSPAPTLQTEIAQVEARVDALEGGALTQASQVYPGAPDAVVVLGKVLFFDKNLSVNRNTACGFCHIPECMVRRTTAREKRRANDRSAQMYSAFV